MNGFYVLGLSVVAEHDGSVSISGSTRVSAFEVSAIIAALQLVQQKSLQQAGAKS